MQSTSAKAGNSTMTRRLGLRPSRGSSHAPTISTSPGCTHSGVIVMFRTREPQFSQELRRDDDRHAGDQPECRAPGRKIFKPEMGRARVEDQRPYDLRHREHDEARVEPARHASQADGIFQLLLEELHGDTLLASFRT